MPEDRLIAADLVLLLLRAPTFGDSGRGRVNGITRLEKLLFLASKQEELGTLVEDDYQFVAYNFGPYSRQVYEEVEILEQADLVREERAYGGETLDELEEIDAVGLDREGIERRFVLTDDGEAVAELLARRFPEAAEKLARVKARYGDMPLARLVRYVYEQYPPYAEKSLIREKVLGKPRKA